MLSTTTLPWLASRAVGTVAMVLLGLTVTGGLAMSTRIWGTPAQRARLREWHEAAALVTFALIATHAGLLLWDHFIHPGLLGITVPFTLSYRPLATGLGVIAAWLTGLFTLSYFVRRRIGPRRWRSLHRFTIVVYVLAVGHAILAGTDATQPWMMATLAGLSAPVAFLLSQRILGRRRTLTPAH